MKLQDAFADMSAVVNEVVNNPNPSVLQNYFDPGDADDVASVFRTIQAMIQVSTCSVDYFIL